MRRLFQFSNEAWRIDLDEEGPKNDFEEGLALNIIENCKLQNEKCKFEREDLTPCWQTGKFCNLQFKFCILH